MKNNSLSLYNKHSALRNNHIKLYENLPDAEIWRLFQNGEGNAFNYIYFNYFPILYNYGCQFTKNKELVKDQIQELFIHIKTRSKKLGEVKDIKFYLIISLKRRLQKVLSTSKSTIYLDDLLPTSDFGIELSHEHVIINNQEQKKVKQKITEAISQLSPKQKEAVLYYYYEGFTYEQIAELMSFSKTEYARKLLYRALGVLKKIITTVIICLSIIYI